MISFHARFLLAVGTPDSSLKEAMLLLVEIIVTAN